ncbi:MAG: aldolase/citrate lyase family protein [Planctomycetota bacterium]|nr:aldolase/citrate lyase family protein [Planctomycetota bacterium]
MTSESPPSGEAGRSGGDARSDLHVRIEAAASGGIEVELRSKVEAYYGDAIREQARGVLADLGISDARVRIDDRGALPFAIAARIDTAARRAGLARQAAATAAPEREPSARDRQRRSRLYLPGNEPKYMTGAGLHGPDAVILDLEDSVHAGEKDAARALVRNALCELDFGSCERMVRINQLPLGQEDLEEVVPAAPDLILIPKVEDPDQVREVDVRIEALQEGRGLRRPLWLMPILESALGVERAFDVARASERVVALTLGLEDLTADLGVPRTKQGDETFYARTRVVNAARAAGVQAIDSVWSDVADAEGLAAWCRRSRALGFEGMGCLHPSQIAIIHSGFAPTDAEIERAFEIVAAFEEGQARGLGVVSLGSKMIDPPVVQRALKIVAQAKALGWKREES